MVGEITTRIREITHWLGLYPADVREGEWRVGWLLVVSGIQSLSTGGGSAVLTVCVDTSPRGTTEGEVKVKVGWEVIKTHAIELGKPVPVRHYHGNVIRIRIYNK